MALRLAQLPTSRIVERAPPAPSQRRPVSAQASASVPAASRSSCRAPLACTPQRRPSLTRAAASTAQAGSASPPVPIVVIDQHTEENATIVELEFGDRLGALLDTVAALKELGLNVLRAKVATTGSVGRNRFVITKGGKKVEHPETIEAIRGTIIKKLLEYHPDSRRNLAMYRGVSKGAGKVHVPTKVLVEAIDEGKRSELYVETADYPGLLLQIVKELRDLSIEVQSAEVDTEGLVAKDYFYVTYHGEALNSSMVQVTKNALTYFLTRPEIEAEESY